MTITDTQPTCDWQVGAVESDVKRCWFVLRGAVLSYYDAPTDDAARRSIELLGSTATYANISAAGRPKIHIRGQKEGRVYVVEADSKKECDAWIDAINQAATSTASTDGFEDDAEPGTPLALGVEGSQPLGVRATAELPRAEEEDAFPTANAEGERPPGIARRPCEKGSPLRT